MRPSVSSRETMHPWRDCAGDNECGYFNEGTDLTCYGSLNATIGFQYCDRVSVSSRLAAPAAHCRAGGTAGPLLTAAPQPDFARTC